MIKLNLPNCLLYASAWIWLTLVHSVVPLTLQAKQSETGTDKRQPVADETKNAGAGTDTEIIEIECKAILRYDQGDRNEMCYLAPIALQPLESGKQYKLKISVFNPTESPMTFTRIRPDWGITKFETDADQIPAKGVASFQMYLTAPNVISERGIVASVRFVDHESGKLKFIVQARYQLFGVFGFKESRLTIDIPQGENLVVARLPVVIALPTSIEQLELRVSDSLRDISAKLVGDSEDKELAYVEFAATAESVAAGSVMGTVDLIRTKGVRSEQKATAFLTVVQPRQPLAISPKSVRLVRDNNGKPFQGTAVLRVERSIEATAESSEATERPKNELVPKLELKVNGNPAKLTTRSMGRTGIFRVTIEYDGPIDLDESGTVEAIWGIEFGGEKLVVKSYAFFPTFEHERTGNQ